MKYCPDQTQPMRGLRLLGCAATLFGFVSLSYAQQAQPAPGTLLTGQALSDALTCHYMMETESSGHAQIFRRKGRWSLTGGRAVEYGTYSTESGAFCVQMSGARRCAELYHLEGDRYYVRSLSDRRAFFEGLVDIKPQERC